MRKSKLRHRNHLDDVGSEDVFGLMQIDIDRAVSIDSRGQSFINTKKVI